MLPKDFIGIWTGLIVHERGAAKVNVHFEGVLKDGSLHGSYSFPDSNPPEKGGKFTAELFGPWLFIKLKVDPRIQFLVHIVGEHSPEMMYGAIPRANGKTAHATVTVFPSKVLPKDWPITGIWQVFFLEGL